MRKRAKKLPPPMTLKEASEIAEMLKLSFRDVVINGSEERPVVIARDHYRMTTRPGRCFCGGETIPSSVAGFKEYQKQQRTYSTEDVL